MPVVPIDARPSGVARLVAIAIVVLVVFGFAVAPVLGAPPTEHRVAAALSAAVASALPELRPRPAPLSIEPPALEVASSPPSRPAVVPAVAPAPFTGKQHDPLARAVNEGRVGRLEGLYVVVGSAAATDWYTAANLCRGRSVDGTRGFRLPSIEELRWLRKRALVDPTHPLWSGTRVFGEPKQTWTLTAAGSQATQHKHTGTARTVCVRGH